MRNIRGTTATPLYTTQPGLRFWFHYIQRRWLRVPAAMIARGCDRILALSNIEGAGKTGCTLHPRSRAQCAQEDAHTSIQVQRGQSGLPCAMALRLMPRSLRRRIRLVTVTAGLMADRPGWIATTTGSLTPATGAETTRFCRTRQHRSSCAPASLTNSLESRPAQPITRANHRVHRIPPRVS